MANYATLKAAISDAIKQNGSNEITGQLLQQQLLAMVNSLGVGYQYAGIASPETNPGTPEQNVFYIASIAGTYANFGGLVLSDGEVSILKYNGAWSKEVTVASNYDDVHWFTQNVYRGYINSGVWADINAGNRYYKIIALPDGASIMRLKANASMASVYYFLSSYAPVNGSSAGIISGTQVAVGNTINVNIPSGTKYLYLLFDSGGNRTPQELEIDGVDFFSLVKFDFFKLRKDALSALESIGNVHHDDLYINPDKSYQGYISGNTWADVNSGYRYYKIIPIPENSKILFAKGVSSGAIICFLSSHSPVNGSSVGILGATISLNASVLTKQQIPSGAKYLYYLYDVAGVDRTPSELILDGLNLFSLPKDDLLFINLNAHNAVEDLRIKNNDLIGISDWVWQRGTLNNTTGGVQALNYRAVTTNVQYTQKVTNISTDSGYQFIIGLYGSDGSWLGYQGTWTDSAVIQKNTYFRIIIRAYPENTSATIDVDTFVSKFHWETIYDDVRRLIEGDINRTGILALNPENEVVPKFGNLLRQYVPYGGGTTYPNVCCLVHFSDLHTDNINLARIKEFTDKYADKIDDVIQTGDMMQYFSQGMPSGYAQTTKFLNVVGNHDTMNREGTAPNYTWVLVDQLNCYNMYMAPYIANWGVTQPADAATYGYNYYYKDYSAKHVRLVVIDNLHWDATQLAWFTSTLADARTNNYHVVVAVHFPPFYIDEQIDKNPFTGIDISNNVAFTDVQAANAVKDFIDAGGNFVCWICGHIHQDVSGFGRASDGFDNQFAISIATATPLAAAGYSEMYREYGDKSQDCFNIIGIDTTTKTLKIMRIGADYDRYMRRRNTMSVNYGTSQIIYADM